MEKLIALQVDALARMQSFFKNYKKDGNDRKSKRSYYDIRLENLATYWSEFKERHYEIISLTLDSNNKGFKTLDYFTNDMYLEVEESYIDYRCTIEEALNQKFPPPQPSNDDTEQPTSGKSSTKIDDWLLRKMHIPKFNGEYENWPTFRDLFEAGVHKKDVPDSQKLYALKTLLEGPIVNTLEDYTIANGQYLDAWNMLNERYNNKRVLVNHELKDLFAQSVIKTENPQFVKGLYDKTNKCLSRLKNLGVDTSTWDAILVYITVQKLPLETHQLWEQSLNDKLEIPKFEDLKKFIVSRFRTLEATDSKITQHVSKFQLSQYSKGHTNKKPQQSFHVNTKSSNCIYCNQQHSLRHCQNFTALNHNNKLKFVKTKGLCINCLGYGHLLSSCVSTMNCNVCGQRHHTILHKNKSDQKPSFQSEQANEQSSLATLNATAEGGNLNANTIDGSLQEQASQHETRNRYSTSTFYVENKPLSCQTLLPTALVYAIGSKGVKIALRALIDQGSQASFVTTNSVQRLNLERERVEARVSGLSGNSINKIQTKVKFSIQSRYNETITIPIEGYVLNNLTSLLPQEKIWETNTSKWGHLHNLELADPRYFEPGNIDLLLGAEVYCKILQEGLKIGSSNSPIAQKTTLGWILSGQVPREAIHFETFHSTLEIEQLNNQLRRFWEIEEIADERCLTEEEELCEKSFNDNFRREKDGRYTVVLPFKKNSSSLNLRGTKNKAIVRLLHLEKRFQQSTPQVYREYAECLQEYLDMGHLIRIPENELKNSEMNNFCYLPHHAVIKEGSTTTRTRVVFDASVRTSENVSLNDCLLNGPNIQEDMFSILIRWRKHNVALKADLAKMYRQIKIADHHNDYQRIVWRKNPLDPIEHFKLSRVTFGTKSAPFLAIRTLHQLAFDEKNNFPTAHRIVLEDFYVDDLISGADSIEEAVKVQTELIELFKSGGFSLRKWSSNNQEILNNLPQEYIEIDNQFCIDREGIKTLGIFWCPKTDNFHYKLSLKLSNQNLLTKRVALSTIAKLFDPLGWISPVIVIGKIFMQTLWFLGCSWDDPLPDNLKRTFFDYCNSLQDIEKIAIPRWLGIYNSSRLQIHGFCDASKQAYAAAIYVRVDDGCGNIKVNLLTSKSKVAPTKIITIARLELCGALLLAKLTVKIKKSMRLHNIPTFSWTDSTIVIAWLRKHPSEWKVFVANRVSQIHQLLGETSWRHVPTAENPADCASRGMRPSDLENFQLWWSGPSWLKNSEPNWPKYSKACGTMIEKRVLSLHVNTKTDFDDLLFQYSSLDKLLHVTAYVLRFVNLCKTKIKKKIDHPVELITTYCLKANEIQRAERFWIRREQLSYFSNELAQLRLNHKLPRESRLIRLTPFLADDDILKVGGRLHNSSLSYSTKFPIILPEKSKITELIIRKTHFKTLHGGLQLMLNILREKYWIVNARNVVRFHIYKCLACSRQKALVQNQLMGRLPSFRVCMSRPFQHTGVDYFGPFNLRASRFRGIKTYKGYGAIFICLAVKAIHIEIVSDMSTQGFILAFKRFISRRGLCSDIYSDCGSNFIGSNTFLKKQSKDFLHEFNNDVAAEIEKEGVRWHFIPPASPHFGGIWEAGVKSIKYHLKRIVGETILTFEEFSTVLAEVEACLNSRPISELSSDPSDMNALTPGHFLVGGPLLSPLEPTLLEKNINRLSRYQLLTKMYQEFWRRWSIEYLTRLQQRPKWVQQKSNLRINKLVLVKDDRLPPSQWMLARVVTLHPGDDGLVRVVTLRTKNGLIKRPITKVALLPDVDESTTKAQLVKE